MLWTSIVAIYILFWTMSLFVVLPFGVRNNAETGEPLVPGQSDGAPVNFNPRRIVLMTTLVASVAFALYYVNYVNGWVGVEALDMLGRKPDPAG